MDNDIMQITIMDSPASYMVKGEGPDVLVLHGWGACKEAMLPVINRLSRFYRVTAVDFPAHGGTPVPPKTWGVPEYAAWTEAFIKTLRLEGCRVLAHSFGGRVALYLAAKSNSLLGDMVLAGSAGLVKEKTAADRRRALRYRVGRRALGALTRLPFGKYTTDKWLQSYRRRHNSADYMALSDGMRGVFDRVVRFDSRALLPRIQNRVLLLWGEEDTETPLWMAEVFRRDIRGSRLSVLPGGHFAYSTYPDAFTDRALDFFDKEDAAC